MGQINFDQESVTVKIVYYGPGMSGKTTNLEVVHQRAPHESRGELTRISTDGDQTLFFDYMPLDLGTVAGRRTHFQIYTVPGQVYYNSARKLVLQGVDGVIFVADSSASMMQENLESLRDLGENLAEYGRDLQRMPMVMQYNKRDMPDALQIADLDRALNTAGWPSCEAVANTGQGVFATLKALAALVLDSLPREIGGAGSELPTATPPVSSGDADEAGVMPPLPAADRESLPLSSAGGSVPEPHVLAMRPPITPDQAPETIGQARPCGGTLSLSASGEDGHSEGCEAEVVEPTLLSPPLQMARASLPEQGQPVPLAQACSPAGEASPAEPQLRMGRPVCTEQPQVGITSQAEHGPGATPAMGAAASSTAPQPGRVGGTMDQSGRVTVAAAPAVGRSPSPVMARRIRPRRVHRATRASTGRGESALITLAFGVAVFGVGVALGGLIFAGS